MRATWTILVAGGVSWSLGVGVELSRAAQELGGSEGKAGGGGGQNRNPNKARKEQAPEQPPQPRSSSLAQ